MPESTLNIVEYLYVQHERFAGIRKQVASASPGFSWRVTLQYSFLTYEMEIPDKRDQRFIPYYHWRRNMNNGTDTAEISCPDEALLLQTRERIHPVSYSEHRAIHTNLEGVFSEDVIGDVKNAEAIASQAYLCTNGDQYAPGFFSSIALSEKGIYLDQVNYLNAKSIAHKSDYHLRSLKFFVPVLPGDVPVPFGSEKMGNMVLQFEDRSSANNRECGRLIEAKIDELRLRLKGR